MSPLVQFASARAWRAVQAADRDIYEAATWLAGAVEYVHAAAMPDEDRDRAREWLHAVEAYIRAKETEARTGWTPNVRAHADLLIGGSAWAAVYWADTDLVAATQQLQDAQRFVDRMPDTPEFDRALLWLHEVKEYLRGKERRLRAQADTSWATVLGASRAAYACVMAARDCNYLLAGQYLYEAWIEFNGTTLPFEERHRGVVWLLAIEDALTAEESRRWGIE